MHCANLDALVKGMNSVQLSPPQATLPAANQSLAETKEDEDIQILKMVLDIGIFVLEGRLPHRKTKRGYVEGPHCVLQPRMQTHRCDYSNYVCERAEKYRGLMESMWNDNQSLCIELRVCADCSCGEEQVWKNSISRFDYVLEQWYFEVTNFRNNEEDIGVMNWYGLLQAIRSQIHFSQLSAWWSSNQAQLPKNIIYRVIPLKQVDANSCPLQHTFPVLAFSSTYLQVKVRSQPRSEVLPKIHCPVHCKQENVVDDRMKIRCDRLGKHHCQALEELDENENETWCDGFMEIETIDELIDKSRTMKYRCPTSDETPKHPRNEAVVNDWRFTTFQKSSNSFTPRHFGYPNSKNLLYSSSSFVQGASSTIAANDHAKLKVDLSSYHSCGSRRQSEAPFGFCNRTNDDAENRVARIRTCTRACCPPDAVAAMEAFKKKDKYQSSFGTVTKTERQCCLMEGKHDAKDENGVVCDERDICDRRGSDCSLTNFVSVVGAGDRCTDSELRFPSRASIRKDSKMVGISGNSGETRENTKLSSKTIVANGKPEPKSDKQKSTVIKKYFRMKKTATKPLLPLFGNVIESVLSGRMYFTRVLDKFKIKITSCVPFGSHSEGTELPAAAYYYHFGDADLSKSYLVKSYIPEREKGIQILSVGQLQVSVFNTENSLIKVFIVPYDLTDMPRCTKTYVRHSNYYAPVDVTKYSIEWLQSLIQFKCICSKSGRLYLQNEINIIIFQKSDLNTACELQQKTGLKRHNVTEIAYK